MQIFYSPYELTPKRNLNRLSSLKKKKGVYLKIRRRHTNHFADFFPHVELGDEELELFLENFKFQNTEYQKKVFYFLLHEEELRIQKPQSFLNHELWDGKSALTEKVCKYKLQAPDDFSFLKIQDKSVILRLDANGCFNVENFSRFLSQIPENFLPRIEYIEDPMPLHPWPSSPISLAEDFIKDEKAQIIIHKPNARFLSNDKKNIFSSYLGSDLGLWHSYLELLKEGDLKLYHGIKTEGFYEEERGIFSSSNMPRMDILKSFYLELENQPWKSLCSL